MRVRLEDLDEKVLKVIERDVLTPERVQKAIQRAQALARVRLKKDPAARRRLESEIKRLQGEKANLLQLSAQRLDDPAAVAKAINERSQRIKTLEAELTTLPDPNPTGRILLPSGRG